MPKKGVLYIATGERYVQQAKVSARITRENTDLPIAIVTDKSIDGDCFDYIIRDDNPTHTYIDKPRNISKSPFDRTLFIDTDAYILEDIDELFAVLDSFQIAACVDPNEVVLRYQEEVHHDDLPKSIPEYNTGVIVFRSDDDTLDFIEKWEKNCVGANTNDQIGFRKSLYESDVRITALSPLYNTLINWPVQVTGEVKIIHGVGGSISKREKINKIEGRVNEYTGVRVLYSCRKGRIVYPMSFIGNRLLKRLSSINRKIYDGVYRPYVYNPKILYNAAVENTKENGIRNTLKKGVKYML